MNGARVRRWTPGRITLIVMTLALWLLLGLLIWQRQAVVDWWRLRNYTPPPDVAQLAEDTTMNSFGKKLFYVNAPRIEPSSDFNEHCRTGGQEFTIVLGCYVSRQGIYLFRVDDDRLSGIEQVTAAHEMLHVGYERLSAGEREKVDRMLARAYTGVSNERIRRNVEQYRAADPSIVSNELHSILGSEQSELPTELEEYYAQYFTDRQKIVAYSQQYEAEFTRREEQANSWAAELNELKPQIEANTAELQSEAVRLQAEYAAIEADRGSASSAELAQRARVYNVAVAEYNTLAAETRVSIERYNSIVEQYNAVVLEQHALYDAIDSTPEAIE